jgi:hypothetical protein
MSTTEINSIIEYLTKNGLTPEDIENDGEYTSLDYDTFWVDVCCADDKINAELHVALDYKFTFTQGCSYYLNSFATDWEIHKWYLKVVFNVRNAQELLITLKKCIEEFNV